MRPYKSRTQIKKELDKELRDNEYLQEPEKELILNIVLRKKHLGLIRGGSDHEPYKIIPLESKRN